MASRASGGWLYAVLRHLLADECQTGRATFPERWLTGSDQPLQMLLPQTIADMRWLRAALHCTSKMHLTELLPRHHNLS